jgi:pilus assembly protein CpaB
MNRIRMLVLAGAALALSVVVTFLAYRLLNEKLKPTEDTSKVIVIRQKVGLGAKLTQADLRVAPWPKSAALQGAFADPAEIVGRGVIVPMDANEPVLESKLAPKNAGAGLMAAIPEGMRAVSVKVNDVIGVAGFVVPGARVDVILTGSPNNGSLDAAKIILQNVEVLAAGQNVDRDSEGKPVNAQVITLLVSPEDTEKLALVTNDGKIHLALRNPLDTDAKSTRAIGLAELYSGTPTSPFASSGGGAGAPKPEAQNPVKLATAPKPATPKPVVAPAPPPAAVAAVTPVEVPRPPQTVEIQLIQGTTSQKFKFDLKPDNTKQ